MKQISKEAKKVFLSILEQLGKKTYMKINVNGKDSGLMPLSVEVKATGLEYQSNQNCFVVSLAHYYEQNGDLMSDPYMEFLVSDFRHLIEPDNHNNVNLILDAVGVWPSCFEQHGIFAKYIELVIFEDGKAVRYNSRMNEYASFCTLWFKNIKYQQKIKTDIKATPFHLGNQVKEAV